MLLSKISYKLSKRLGDWLFPTFHRMAIEHKALEKKLAKFKKKSDASYLGINRRKLRDRRKRIAANDAI